MIKHVAIFSLFLAICFLLPMLFLNSKEVVKNDIANNNSEYQNLSEDVKKDNTKIRLLLRGTNEVEELTLEDYIKGVVFAEMPSTFEMEALKAQAVVARTYAINKIINSSNNHEGADICDDINCCQAYKKKGNNLSDEAEAKWKKVEDAVLSTAGIIITYDKEPIMAFFHSHSGGQTEDIKYVWGEESVPYLKSVDGMEDDRFPDRKTFSKEQFKDLIKEECENYDYTKDKISIIDYTGSGRVNNISIGDKTIKATKLRSLIDIRSTNFRVEENEDSITFYTVGYGHGVGMSQYGANKMASEGKNYKDIILHYYTGVEISNLK